jgi:hypothetical protein
MKVGLGGALLLASTLGLSLLTGPAVAMPADSPMSATLPSPTSEPRGREFLPVCDAAVTMNCIESIEYRVGDQWQQALLALGQGQSQDFVYETPLLSHEGGRTAIRVALLARDDITGPPYPAYFFQIQSHPQDDVLWDPPINRCEEGDPSKPTGSDPCARAPWLADTEYRFTFRSDDLIPVFAQSTVVGMSTSVTDIPGGLRIAVAGRPGGSQWVLDYDVAGRTDRFDALTYEWYGFATDIRANGGALEECAGLGFATAYSNGNGGSIPQWNPRTGSLSFNVDGFHYRPDGSVYKGEAQVFVPGPLARCMWKVDPRQAARMEIEVFAENGEEAVGTKSVSYDVTSDLVKLIATNFTYSQKGVVARPTPTLVRPGKKACDVAKSACVTLDRQRRTAKVTLIGVTGASEIIAVALRGATEDGRSEVRGAVRNGSATLTVKLAGAKSRNEVWVLRSPSTFLASFQIG